MFSSRIAAIPLFACLLLPEWADGQQPVILKHNGSVVSLAFSPEGKYLATGITDTNPGYSLVVWDLAKGKEFKVLKGHPRYVTQLVWTDSNSLVSLYISLKSDTLGAVVATTWNLPEGKVKGKREFLDLFTVQAVSRDGKLMVTVSGNPTQYAQVWELETGKRVALLDGGAKHIFRTTFSADGSTLVTAATDGLVKVWDVKTFQEKLTFKSFGNVSHLVVSPTGDQIVTRGLRGVAERLVEAWDLTGKTPRRTVFESIRFPFAFSPDGKTLAATGFTEIPGKSYIQVWDVRAGKMISQVEVNSFQPEMMAFSPDGTRLAVHTGTHELWLFTLPLKKQGEEKAPQKK